jgi:hypothetical protein
MFFATKVTFASPASLLCAAAIFAGCAQEKESDPSLADPTSLRQSMARDSATAQPTLSQLTSTDSGLELRKWVIADDPVRIESALAKHRDGEAVDPSTAERLQHNGLRLVRVPVDQVSDLLVDIGGATFDVNGWYGQVHHWHEFHARPIDSAERVVFIDGHVRRFRPGAMRMMGRSWTVAMEDGPYLQLELLPQYARPQTGDLRRLLGEEITPEATFPSASIDARLESGYAYVLTCESPDVIWPDPPAAAPAGSDAPDGAPALGETGADAFLPPPPAPASDERPTAPPNSVRRASGPDDGPAVTPPDTLGEMLLMGRRTPATRGVLIFIPRIAGSEFPPEPLQNRPAGAPASSSGQ